MEHWNPAFTGSTGLSGSCLISQPGAGEGIARDGKHLEPFDCARWPAKEPDSELAHEHWSNGTAHYISPWCDRIAKLSTLLRAFIEHRNAADTVNLVIFSAFLLDDVTNQQIALSDPPGIVV